MYSIIRFLWSVRFRERYFRFSSLHARPYEKLVHDKSAHYFPISYQGMDHFLAFKKLQNASSYQFLT